MESLIARIEFGQQHTNQYMTRAPIPISILYDYGVSYMMNKEIKTKEILRFKVQGVSHRISKAMISPWERLTSV